MTFVGNPNGYRDKYRGCMYGLAIGDALGAAVEFNPRGTFPPVTDYRGGGPHGIEAGAWTDDTSMALALADSIASVKGFDAKDQLDRYSEWLNNGKYSVNGYCFDIGNATHAALMQFWTQGRLSADTDDRLSGNGSIMRFAPVAIFCHQEIHPTKMASLCSSTTHGSRLCTSACEFLYEFLMMLFDCDPEECEREKLLNPSDWIESFNLEPEIFSAVTSWNDGNIQGSGYVVESLKAALWAFMSSSTFEEAVLKAVNLGDDSDTTGAICGQMAGAYWGYEGIPQHLIDGLVRKDMIDLYLEPLLPKIRD